MDTIVTDRFITDKLKANGTLTAALANGTASIWLDTIPPDASFPCVQVYPYGDPDDLWQIRYHIWMNSIYIVRGITEGRSFAPLRTIAREITSTLEATSGTNSDGEVFGIARLHPHRMVESRGDLQFRYLGAFFRVFSKEY